MKAFLIISIFSGMMLCSCGKTSSSVSNSDSIKVDSVVCNDSIEADTVDFCVIDTCKL